MYIDYQTCKCISKHIHVYPNIYMYIQTYTCILTLDLYTGKLCLYIYSIYVYRYSIDIHKHITLEFVFIIYTNLNTCTGRVCFNQWIFHAHTCMDTPYTCTSRLPFHLCSIYIYKSAPNMCTDRVSFHVHSTRVHLYSTYIHRQIFLLNMFHIYTYINSKQYTDNYSSMYIPYIYISVHFIYIREQGFLLCTFHVYSHTYLNIHMYTYMYVNIHIYIYIYIFIFIVRMHARAGFPSIYVPYIYISIYTYI